MALLGQLVVQLAADTARFQGDLGRAATIAEQRMSRIRDVAGKALAGVSVAAAAAGAALIAFTRAGINRADDFRDLAAASGQTVEAFSRLQFAAQQSGVSTEEFAQAMQRLAVKIKDTPFQSTDEALRALAGKFETMPDGVDKTALAVEYFGRTGAKLIPLLNQGTSGLAELEAQADRLGLTITTETSRAADEFNDRLGELRAVGTGFSNMLANELLPTLNVVAEQFIRTGKAADLMRGYVELIGDAAKVTLSSVEGIALAGTVIATTYRGAFAAIKEAARGNLTGAVQILSETLDGIEFEIADSVATWQKIWSEGLAGLADDTTRSGSFLKDFAFDTAQSLIATTAYLEKSAKDVKDWRDGWFDALLDVEIAAERTLVQDMERISQESADRLADLKGPARETFDGLVAAAEEASRGMHSALKNFFLDPAEGGLRGFARSVVDVFREVLANVLALKVQLALFGEIDKKGNFSGGLLSGVLNGIFGGLFGFQHGGSVTVGGSGGPDSQLFAARVSPGERIDFTPPGKARGGARDLTLHVTNQIHVDSRADASYVEQRVAAGVAMAIDISVAEMQRRLRGGAYGG